MADETAIKVENVSKTFKLPHEKSRSIKSAVVNFYRRKRTFEKQQALQDVSFEIKKGEFFGIVGRNGSGKSTLLKLLAGIYEPDKGNIQVNGKLTPFIELGVGFNPELTGRENVYLNGALLGFNRREMGAMYDDIVAFAELKRFMDQKLKNYSSGMQVRLAFSIAIRARSDILLIDEVLAVGDVSFQQKCYNYFDRLKEEKKTIVLVSHDMGAIKQFCDRALFINEGRVQQIGKPEEGAQAYERMNYSETPDETPSQQKEAVSIMTINQAGSRKDKFEHGEPIRFEVSWPPNKAVSIAGVVIYKGSEVVFATNTLDQGYDFSKNKAILEIAGTLGDGRYKFSSTIFGKNQHTIIATSKIKTFLVYGQPLKGEHSDEWEGMAYVQNKWV
jgi:ABC-2 type transport system ATP-binding protein